jgi:predicted esterase
MLTLALALGGCRFAPGKVELDDTAAERCQTSDDEVACDFVTVVFNLVLAFRDVHLQHPSGEPPPEGWPAVILFQGAFFSAQGSWKAGTGDPFGGFHQAELIRDLLDAGYAVITPEARYGGASGWQTNLWPDTLNWRGTEDHKLMMGILAAIDRGDLGPIDADSLFAAGISSGGYMTSRCAKAYPGRFRALAIQSASWATCNGPACVLPLTLPADHPPTLFLHGALDPLVPVGTMERYADALEDDGVVVERVVDDGIGHAWLPDAPQTVVAWFDRWR